MSKPHCIYFFEKNKVLRIINYIYIIFNNIIWNYDNIKIERFIFWYINKNFFKKKINMKYQFFILLLKIMNILKTLKKLLFYI